MQIKHIMFSVNDYDLDGYATDEGIFLHFGGTRVKAAESLEDFRTIVQHMESMVREIEENYPHAT